MGMSANVKSAPGPLSMAVTGSSAVHPLIEDLKQTASAALGKRLERMFAAAADLLLERSEQAASEGERHAHFDAMRTLSFEQARILRSFEREVARAFDPGSMPAPVDGPADLRMALLPEQDMEENIHLTRMATKAKNHSKSLLNSLETRLEGLESALALGPVHRALSPRRFCDLYCVCLNKLDLGYGVRKLLLNVFDSLVLDDLDPVYRELHAAVDRHMPRVEAPPAAYAAQAVMQVPSEQREEILAKVQRVVAYEMAALVNGHRLHPGARRFLCCAMAPLMSVRLLRHGVHSKMWHDALTRVSHILRTLEPRLNQPEHGMARAEYVDATVSDLREIGFQENRIAELLGALQEAFAEADALSEALTARRKAQAAHHAI